MKRNHLLWLIPVVLMLALFLTASCGDDGNGDESDGDNNNNKPVEGELFLADQTGADIWMPIITTISVSAEDFLGFIYVKGSSLLVKRFDPSDTNLETELEEFKPDTGLGSNIIFGVTEYAVNERFFSWNANESTYRYQWGKTVKPQIGLALVPGNCIYVNDARKDTLVGVQDSGQLLRVELFDFEKPFDSADLVDPASETNQTVAVKAFSCSADRGIGFVATKDGRVFRINLGDPQPSLGLSGVPEFTLKKATEDPLVNVDLDKDFSQMQYAHPYLVWVDKKYDIKMYNVQTKEYPKRVVDVDPNGFMEVNHGSVTDMRIFGSILLWSDMSSGQEGNYDIWGADIKKMANERDFYQITKDPDGVTADQRYPYLFKSTVYWVDNRNGKSEIFRGALPTM